MSMLMMMTVASLLCKDALNYLLYQEEADDPCYDDAVSVHLLRIMLVTVVPMSVVSMTPMAMIMEPMIVTAA